jgi:hypothetical protein
MAETIEVAVVVSGATVYNKERVGAGTAYEYYSPFNRRVKEFKGPLTVAFNCCSTFILIKRFERCALCKSIL